MEGWMDGWIDGWMDECHQMHCTIIGIGPISILTEVIAAHAIAAAVLTSACLVYTMQVTPGELEDPRCSSYPPASFSLLDWRAVNRCSYR